MKLRPAHFGFAALAVTTVLVFLAPHAARAWTIDERSGVNADGTPKFVDPDEQVQNFGRYGSGNSNSSGPQFFFGRQSSDQARNPWSNPATRPLSPDSFYRGNNNFRD